MKEFQLVWYAPMRHELSLCFFLFLFTSIPLVAKADPKSPAQADLKSLVQTNALPTQTYEDRNVSFIEAGARTGASWARFEYPAGEAPRTFRAGFTLGMFVHLRIYGVLAIQPEFQYIDKGTNIDSSTGNAFANNRVRYLAVPLLVRVNIPSMWRLNPYIVAGPATSFTIDSTSDNLSDMEDPRDRMDDTRLLEFGITAGAGVSMVLVPQLALTLDARYDYGLTNVYEPDSMSDTRNRAFIVTFGLSRIQHDTDGDGIRDRDDQCWLEAEDKDGFEDLDGCPDPDDDNDGILGDSDRCPDQAEDRDGFADQDGCPDPDNDNDGVLDINDKCPNSAFNKPDGCPPTYKWVVVTDARIQLKQHILFDPASDLLFESDTPERNALHKAILRDLVTALTDYPHLRVRIRGHADGEGSRGENERLSQRRADAVRDHLINEGIKADRLVAKGYGEEEPIHQEDTESARQKNRRVDDLDIINTSQ